ncbi:MAG: TIM barrel protein, partial [Planctomycetota bacterium]
AKDNIVAWCIVPFDGKKRGPVERAAMLSNMGLKRVAYDWREEHVPSFEEEIEQYKAHGIEYFAFWGVHDEALRLFEKHGLHPQIWLMLPQPQAESQNEKVVEAAEQLLPTLQRLHEQGCQLGIYNHGGWSGEPANMAAICDYLNKEHDVKNVGIVYNFHHGHEHLATFADDFAKMKPHLLCINLNGMTESADAIGRKIMPLGHGQLDVELLRTIQTSGYRGPIGIIGHTQDDVEQRLLDNLDGLEWIVNQLKGNPAGPRPELRIPIPSPNEKVAGD